MPGNFVHKESTAQVCRTTANGQLGFAVKGAPILLRSRLYACASSLLRPLVSQSHHPRRFFLSATNQTCYSFTALRFKSILYNQLQVHYSKVMLTNQNLRIVQVLPPFTTGKIFNAAKFIFSARILQYVLLFYEYL